MIYDTIVLGVGGMGSAACYHLARRGERVLGLERFAIPHEMGSSHGLTRILRLAYFEGAFYVPLVQRARELWIELGAAGSEQVFFECGAVDLAAAGSAVVENSLASCRIHGLEHQVLEGAALAARLPAFRLPAGYMGVLQPQSGFVASERAILAHVGLAIAAGAEIHAHEPVLGFERSAGGGVTVRTARGTYEAGRLIVSAGAWLKSFAPALAAVSQPVRQSFGWFAPRDARHLGPDHTPSFTLEVPEGHFYGMPLWGHPGFKIGGPQAFREPCDPDTVDRSPRAKDEPALRDCLERYIPDAAGPSLGIRGCMYTMTPDENFIIDRLPGFEEVIVLSPCSGHGFKFASAIGEIAADLATDTTPRFDLAPFRIARFAV